MCSCVCTCQRLGIRIAFGLNLVTFDLIITQFSRLLAHTQYRLVHLGGSLEDRLIAIWPDDLIFRNHVRFLLSQISRSKRVSMSNSWLRVLLVDSESRIRASCMHLLALHLHERDAPLLVHIKDSAGVTNLSNQGWVCNRLRT